MDQLFTGKRYSFKNWPNPDLPDVAIGVYTVWDHDRFLYVGIAGTALTKDDVRKAKHKKAKSKGLYNRIKSHRQGVRGGDKFCIYIGDRFVLPSLSRDQIQQIGDGSLTLDNLIREYIHQNLSYRFILVDDAREARAIENRIKAGNSLGGKPFLNPSE